MDLRDEPRDEREAPDDAVEQLRAENEELRRRLADSEDTIRAIKGGEVDAFVVQLDQGERIYSLRGAEHAYYAFVQHMREGALTVSEDGTILYANRRIVDILGSPFSEVVGSNVIDHVAPEDGYVAEALLQRGRGRESGGEVSLVGRRGNRVPVHFAVFPVDLDGLLTACVLVNDLTELNRYRYDVDKLVETRTAELLAEQEELRRANEGKNLLVGRLSGEIGRRTAELERTVDRLRANAASEALACVDRELMQMKALIEDVGILGEIESGNASLRISAVRLRDVAMEVMELVRPAADARRDELVLDVPTTEIVQFMADAGKLKQVLASLLLSAIEHTSGETLRLRVGVTEDLVAKIELRQPGASANEEDLGLLLEGRFEPDLIDRVASQVDALSLWVASRMVRFLGGSLTARSEQGALVFSVSLPV